MRKLIFLLPILLAGCAELYLVKENLAEGQILNPVLIRKPTGIKSWGFVPVYEDILEGHILGGLNDPKGTLVQGVTVKVLNDKGEELPGFSAGITDAQGHYKIRFAAPIRWNRVDFSGKLVCGPEWSVKTPDTGFRLYFNRRTGVLSYTPKTVWTTVTPQDVSQEPQEPASKKIQKSPAEPKKAEDFFGNFDFGK